MSAIDEAIVTLETEVDAFGQGGPAAPKPGTSGWFVLRAKALAMSHLRRMKQLGLDNDITGRAAEEHYRGTAKLVKGEVLAALLDAEQLKG